MIVEMKKVTILAPVNKSSSVISSLRDFGLVHVEDIVNKTSSAVKIEQDNSRYNKIISFLESYCDKNKKSEVSLRENDERLGEISQKISSLIDEESSLNEKNRALTSEIERIKFLGEFNPEEIKNLSSLGYDITFYNTTKKDKEKLREKEDITFVSIKTEGKNECIALINSKPSKDIPLSPISLPLKSLSSYENELFINKKRIEEIEKIYRESTVYIPLFKDLIRRNDEEILYRRVTATMKESDSVCYISGYIPSKDVDKFKNFSLENNLGYIIDDPSREDNPPTKMEHKGFIRFVQPLYDALGLVPGYREKDISLYFLVFMSLFFAMILGDAGYGLLLLIGGVLLNVKCKKCSDMNALIYIFSGATVLWGALTGTWFGSEIILEKISFLKLFVIPELTNFPEMFNMDANVVQNNVMSFCFSLGAIHLSLARALCIFDKIKNKDISLLSDFGWLMNTILLYLLSLYLVVDAVVPLGKIAIGVVTGFILVCLFASCEPGKPLGQGIKESLSSFFTNFLDTISCFSNVMSYIRLFAVGLASLAIAQSFNGMAEGLMSGFTIPLGILILILGHAVNLVMGFLSVIVHGVRLNIMEFSGQVGVEWSGYKYEPFSLKGNNKVVETQRS